MNPVKRGCLFLASVLSLLASPAAAQMDVLRLPPRPANTVTGTQFKDQVLTLDRAERELQIYNEVTRGNVPDFMRALKPVTVSANVGGTPYTLTYYVTPDYLAVGSNADYFRLPMSPLLAQWIADFAQASLPTRKMVNDIWSAAQCKLSPSTIPPDGNMITVPVFWQHQQTVQGQRNGAGNPLGDLVGGHKKDVVITPLLYQPSTPNRVAIYGWHYTNGANIQPLYLGHEETYADYSHGIRLVNNIVALNSTTATLQSILTHANTGISGMVNNETTQFGVSAPPRYAAGSPPAGFPYVDAFPSTGRQLGGWVNRFTAPATQAFSPASPGGDGYVSVVRDPSGGIDTTRLGYSTDADYFVQCYIHCQYRPEVAADGFERVGIFARDNGNGMFCGQNTAGTIKGANYALTWDSHDGRVQCLRTVNGIATDMLTSPTYNPTTAWRLFRIEAVGTNIKFKLDGATVLDTVDATHASGPFGIGYQEQFTSNANIRGTHADSFRAEVFSGETSTVGSWSLY